jgi:formylglycine-generating enzyme required for sulfatase activity
MAEGHRQDPANLVRYDDGFCETAPVMSLKPNKLGIYDLGGNVAEWCEEWLDASKQGRVVRGGSYRVDARDRVISSYRTMSNSTGFPDVGFRVVMETR